MSSKGCNDYHIEIVRILALRMTRRTADETISRTTEIASGIGNGDRQRVTQNRPLELPLQPQHPPTAPDREDRAGTPTRRRRGTALW